MARRTVNMEKLVEAPIDFDLPVDAQTICRVQALLDDIARAQADGALRAMPMRSRASLQSLLALTRLRRSVRDLYRLIAADYRESDEEDTDDAE